MALVTVQRSTSPHRHQIDQLQEDDIDEGAKSDTPRRSRRSQRSLKKLVNTVNTIRFVNRLRFSESYFTIKGAALILPKSNQFPPVKRQRTKSKSSLQVTGIKNHLQCMFNALRAEDTVQIAIKLDSVTGCSRYLAIVVTDATTNFSQESVLLGFHCTDDVAEAHIGLVLPVYRNTEIVLDGDGGFRIVTEERYYIFKPVGVQAMWSAWMAFTKVCAVAQNNNHISGGPTHSWLSHYTDKVTTEQSMVNEWDQLDDLMVRREDSAALLKPEDSDSVEREIRSHLREVMVGKELEDVTAYQLRIQLEKILNRPLREYRKFIDQEMMLIIRQLDVASQIFDFLYLGSEWNASNLQDLQATGIGYILNVTKEIDNFFPGMFKYKNIRLYDVEQANLLKHWEHTYKFICEARDNNSKVLVHCKMGVSRSASTVIAFAMKEYGWSLDHAIQVVRGKRAVANPNDGFMQQLQTYEGILNASKQRWNPVFESATSANSGRAGSIQVNSLNSREQSEMNTMVETLDAQEEEAQKGINERIAQSISTEESNSTNTDSDSDYTDSDTCSSSSTVSYQLLEEDSVFSSNSGAGDGTDQAVVGLHYSRLVTDDTCPHISSQLTHACTPQQQQQSNPSSQMQTTALNQDSTGLHEVDSTTSTSPCPEAGVCEDVAVCHGVVQKTKEQIAIGLPQSQITINRTEEPVPVTPGTVRKVLGKIEQRAPDDNTAARSASFKLERRDVQTKVVIRSASARAKNKSPPTSAEAVSLDTNAELTFTTAQQEMSCSEKPVKFCIGEEPLTSHVEPPEKSSANVTIPLVEKGTIQSTENIEPTEHSNPPQKRFDAILKVASKCRFPTSCEIKPAVSNSPPVRELVGAFEDIGCTGGVNRPLTIHVDSFNSDPFTRKASGASISPLQRSQSLKAFHSKHSTHSSEINADTKHEVQTTNTSTHKVLPPCWKVKQDQRLQHSLSTATMSSKGNL